MTVDLPVPTAGSALARVVDAIDAHLADGGWDRPPLLFALVDAERLRREQPQLAARLRTDGPYTPVEQEALPSGDLGSALAGIMWPPEVSGCALAQEVLILPPGAEADRPDGSDPQRWAAGHDARREARLVVAVLADGRRAAGLRLRGGAAGARDEILTGPDLAPNLAAALLGTLR